jgi:hypothetical protein
VPYHLRHLYMKLAPPRNCHVGCVDLLMIPIIDGRPYA